jgi:hypothetical protein
LHFHQLGEEMSLQTQEEALLQMLQETSLQLQKSGQVLQSCQG